MALELFLGPVVSVTISKVISLASEQLALGVGYEEELDSFCTTLNMVKDLLFDAEQKQGASAVKTWLKKLREIADEADAVMDDIAYENLRPKVAAGKPKFKQVSNLFCFCGPVVGRLEMANKIKELDAALDKLNKQAAGLGLQQMLANRGETRHRELVPQTNSLLGNASKVIGRDVDVQNIVSLLIDSSKFDQPLGVVSIVGVGGLGKTTLAKLVCNNEKIQGHFSKIMWVCVSEKFEVESILGEMLQSLTSGPRMDITNQDTLVQKIKNELQEKNYLLVLDDVWDVDGPKWVSFRENCLMGITKSVGSSRVLVTTRLERVATMMRSVPGSIQKLGDDVCWSIIKQQAFGSSLVPAEFEVIGKKIAIKCRGVPLVANSIGGTLYNYRNEDEWLSVEKKFDATGDDGVLQALKLSFDRLPRAALKQCFAFCAIFPKDFVMRKDMLIQLWMAEGFLEALDVGENYFKDLVSYSFFQDVVWDSYGSIVSCKLHDFMHDLAKSISESEILVLEDNRTIDFGGIRHLNLICAPSVAPTKTIKAFQKLHSLFLKVDISCDTLVNSKKLLALSFRGADISELPCFLGELKRLRYLDISETEIQEIPKFINKLYLLQTFRFMNCRRLEKPPEEIENLVSLKHICFSKENHMPAGIGSLTCLQTLEIFFVGHERGYQIQELGHLSKLRGKLEICNLENIRNREDAGRANLREKTALVELVLVFGSDLSVDQCKHHCDILESLEPHSNLKGLFLKRYGGEKCPSWMSKCVGTVDGLAPRRNLLRMGLYDCPHLESTPSLSLSKEALLEIRGCKSLKSIEDSLTQRLIISDCVELTLLQFGPLAIKHLKEIHIEKCDKMETLPMVSSLSCLEVLKLENCSNLNTIGRESSSPLKSLKELHISKCHALAFFPSLDGCVSLERIRISYCLQLKSIEGEKLSSCMSLKELHISGCYALTSIPSLDGLLSIEKICILNCSKLKSIKKESLTLSSRLKEAIVCDWHALASLSVLHGLSCLVNIYISGCKRLKSIIGESLLSATHLRELKIQRCPALTSIPSLDGLLSLEKISISNCQQLKNIDGESLSTSICLKELSLSDCPALTYIPSLHGLSSLEDISIVDCRNLRSIGVDEGLSLSSFPRLERLAISYCLAVPSVPSLHGLSSLERIQISKFQQWIGFEDNFPFSMCLKDLSIESCPSLASIPSLDGLSRLQSLRICDCPALTNIPSLDGLLSLEEISIRDCRQLKSIDGESLSTSTCLKDLSIVSCPSLASIPSLDGLSRLQSLRIRDCGGLTSLPDGLSTLLNLTELALGGFSGELDEFPDLSFVQDFHCSLKKLTLVGWKKLKHLPHHIQCLTALTELTIRDCGGLEALPDWLENFSSLWSLSVHDCGSITRFPDVLSSLRHLTRLELGGFSEDMEEFPDLSFIQHLRCSLKRLNLVGWEKLKHLPHQIQCLTALTCLIIQKFNGLEVLPDWLENLSSLVFLFILNCKSLKDMPSLEAMQCLSQLKYLHIHDCPELEARCASESGSEWHKISHIEDIRIGSNQNDDNEPEIGTTSSVATHDQHGEAGVNNNNDDREQESETTSAAVAACDDQQSESTAANVDDDYEHETERISSDAA